MDSFAFSTFIVIGCVLSSVAAMCAARSFHRSTMAMVEEEQKSDRYCHMLTVVFLLATALMVYVMMYTHYSASLPLPNSPFSVRTFIINLISFAVAMYTVNLLVKKHDGDYGVLPFLPFNVKDDSNGFQGNDWDGSNAEGNLLKPQNSMQWSQHNIGTNEGNEPIIGTPKLVTELDSRQSKARPTNLLEHYSPSDDRDLKEAPCRKTFSAMYVPRDIAYSGSPKRPLNSQETVVKGKSFPDEFEIVRNLNKLQGTESTTKRRAGLFARSPTEKSPTRNRKKTVVKTFPDSLSSSHSSLGGAKVSVRKHNLIPVNVNRSKDPGQHRYNRSTRWDQLLRRSPRREKTLRGEEKQLWQSPKKPREQSPKHHNIRKQYNKDSGGSSKDSKHSAARVRRKRMSGQFNQTASESTLQDDMLTTQSPRSRTTPVHGGHLDDYKISNTGANWSPPLRRENASKREKNTSPVQKKGKMNETFKVKLIKRPGPGPSPVTPKADRFIARSRIKGEVMRTKKKIAPKKRSSSYPMEIMHSTDLSSKNEREVPRNPSIVKLQRLMSEEGIDRPVFYKKSDLGIVHFSSHPKQDHKEKIRPEKHSREVLNSSIATGKITYDTSNIKSRGKVSKARKLREVSASQESYDDKKVPHKHTKYRLKKISRPWSPDNSELCNRCHAIPKTKIAHKTCTHRFLPSENHHERKSSRTLELCAKCYNSLHQSCDQSYTKGESNDVNILNLRTDPKGRRHEKSTRCSSSTGKIRHQAHGLSHRDGHNSMICRMGSPVRPNKIRHRIGKEMAPTEKDFAFKRVELSERSDKQQLATLSNHPKLSESMPSGSDRNTMSCNKCKKRYKRSGIHTISCDKCSVHQENYYLCPPCEDCNFCKDKVKLHPMPCNLCALCRPLLIKSNQHAQIKAFDNGRPLLGLTTTPKECLSCNHNLQTVNGCKHDQQRSLRDFQTTSCCDQEVVECSLHKS